MRQSLPVRRFVAPSIAVCRPLLAKKCRRQAVFYDVLSGYFLFGDGKLVSLGWIETSVDDPAAVFGFCCFGFLASRLPRC